MPRRALVASVSAALSLTACARGPLVVTPLADNALVCPIDGCGPPPPELVAKAPSSVCPSAGDAPCGGASSRECTQRALSVWSDAEDDRTVGCVAQMLSEACSLGDAHACLFAGRLWTDGRGVGRDAPHGVEMLVKACDGGERIACATGMRWLVEPAHAREVPDALPLRLRLETELSCLLAQAEGCYQTGLLFYFGAPGYPRDRARAAEAYRRGCDLGAANACNNLGDALAYGEGVSRDVERAAAMFDKACHLGEALGCANFGYMFEHGQGVPRDRQRARGLYRNACSTGEVYGCLHGEMLAAEEAGAPRDGGRALAHWRRACEARDAKACAFVGVIYEDGADGLARDEAKSIEAMTRACDLGDRRACEWMTSHRTQ